MSPCIIPYWFIIDDATDQEEPISPLNLKNMNSPPTVSIMVFMRVFGVGPLVRGRPRQFLSEQRTFVWW